MALNQWNMEMRMESNSYSAKMAQAENMLRVTYHGANKRQRDIYLYNESAQIIFTALTLGLGNGPESDEAVFEQVYTIAKELHDADLERIVEETLALKDCDPLIDLISK
jgi:hypothetical protein